MTMIIKSIEAIDNTHTHTSSNYLAINWLLSYSLYFQTNEDFFIIVFIKFYLMGSWNVLKTFLKENSLKQYKE